MNNFTQPLIFLVAALSLAVVGGTCTCGAICYSYVPGAWRTLSTCPAPLTQGGIFIPKFFAGWNYYPGGGCVCNSFGCDCTACYCDNQGRRTTTHEATSICEDYHTYMNMTRSEKVEHLASAHCTKQSTSGEVVIRQPRKNIDKIIESIADVDNDGDLTCEEFNNAHFDMDGFEHLCLE